MEIFLIICTILGGIAALWFFYEKSKGKLRWKRPKKFNFPSVVVKQISDLLPSYRMPNYDDITGEWADNFDEVNLKPFFCRGNFRGTGTIDYAFFVFSISSLNSKIVVLSQVEIGKYRVYDLEGGSNRNYVSTLPPGEYKLCCGPDVLSLKRDGIEVGVFETSSQIYYWDDKSDKFVSKFYSD